ncbi:MAG: PAS domain-containing protein [Actinomycetota bacterium]
MASRLYAQARAGLMDGAMHGSRVGIAVATLDDGVVGEANEAFCALVGRGMAEVLGSSVEDLGLWDEHGSERARRLLRDTGLIDGFDARVETAEGETRFVRFWAELVSADEPLVIFRASDVDGRASVTTRYRELRKTEVRYRALIEQLPAIIYTEVPDPNAPGVTEYMSPQLEQVLGYTPEEWLADAGLWEQRLHPDDREAALAEDRATEITGDRFRFEYRLIAKDGHVVWIRDEAVRMEEPATGLRFWQGMMVDITEEVTARSRQAETEAKYRALIEQIPAVVYLAEYGDDGDWLYISPQIERVIGFTPQEWLDHPAPMATLVHPDDLTAVRDEEERSLRTGTPFRTEYRMRRRDGGWVWIVDEASAVRDTDGTVMFLQGLMYDISERKEAEHRLVALDRLKNTLLHTLSHDLKEPLTAILGAASTLERLDLQLDPHSRGDLLRTLVERTKGMNALLTDLLDLDRLDRGIIEPRRFPVDLDELVRELVARVPSLHDHQVAVVSERCMINADATKVERMVENLLVNAARHTPAGSRVWVRVWSGEAGATIAVEDDGPGVPDGLKEALFEPFRRGPNVAHAGSGIGLSLVARFAEIHHGIAWVEDREGGGASFRVFLPAEPASS